MALQRGPRPYNCLTCDTTFYPTTGDVSRGKGRFCSRRCSNYSRHRPLAERFREQIGETLPNGCVLWTGSTVAEGWHGVISNGGRGGKLLVASRVAWELANGPIPAGLFVLHNCPGGDNPLCVNVAHLFLGTQADNLADMTAKGRRARGERLTRRNLTDDMVREIRRRVGEGESQLSLSKEFHISPSMCCKIVKRRGWAHVA